MIDLSMAGRVVLITGAGSGIGRAAADAFARAGASLALMGRRRAPLEQAAAELAAGHRCQVEVLVGDVSQQEDVRATVAGTLERFARLDTLVNCAGVAAPATLLHETTDEDWETLLAVNLGGTFRMTRAALEPMLASGNGAILNIASIAGLVGMARLAAYGASKGGVIALTRALAAEYGPRGIRCNCLCPGIVDTPMTAAALARPAVRDACSAANPLGRIAAPREIAEAIVFLGSPASSFINGAVIPIDGGHTAL